MANIPTRNNNPGNIRGADGNFKTFKSPLEGQAALYNDLTVKMTGKSRTGLNGDSTLYEFVQKYAPKGDGANDPVSYTAALANELKISPDTKIGTLMPRIDDFAKAVARHEGMDMSKWASGNPSNTATFNPTPFSSGAVDLTQKNTPDAPKGLMQGALNAAKGFAVGVGKGTTGLLGGIGDRAINGISDALMASPNVIQQHQQERTAQTTPKGNAQKVGSFVGGKVLPAVAAATTAGMGATALGGNVPAVGGKVIKTALTGGGLIGNLVRAATVDKVVKSATGKSLLKWLAEEI